MSDTTTKENRAMEQAKAQLESIVEMVRALDREAAAEDYAATLGREKCLGLLADYEDKPDDIDELRELVANGLGRDTLDDDDFEFDEDEARERIQEDPLEVSVRSGWYPIGSDETAPEEFKILLCTGGPAVRIVGELDAFMQPFAARLQYQDWFTPWEDYHIDNEEDEKALLTYCQQFYFGD